MDYIHIPYPVYISLAPVFLCAVAVVGHDDVARVLFSLRLAWYGYHFIIRFNISNGIELQTKHWNALHQNIHVIFGNVINKGTTKFKRSRETGSNFIISHRSPSISRHGMAWQNDCMCMCVCEGMNKSRELSDTKLYDARSQSWHTQYQIRYR